MESDSTDSPDNCDGLSCNDDTSSLGSRPLFSSDDDMSSLGLRPLFSIDEFENTQKRVEDELSNSFPLFSSHSADDDNDDDDRASFCSCPLYSSDEDDFVDAPPHSNSPVNSQEQSGFGLEECYEMLDRRERIIRKFNVTGTEYNLRISLEDDSFANALERLHDVLERKFLTIVCFK